MRQLNGVLWTKGTLLTPQHLQIQDRYLQDIMHFGFTSLAFRPFGLTRLEVDREELSNGVFSVSAVSGLFPDGLAIDIPDSDKSPPCVAIDSLWLDSDQESLTVHLVVPEYRMGTYNIATDEKKTDARYYAEVVLRRDENTGKAEKPVQVARKNLRLVGAVDKLEGGSMLPIARIIRGAAGDYQLDAEFVPPVLNIFASNYLSSMLRRLLEVVTARSSELSNTRRQRGTGLADFGVSDVANFWLLYTLNSQIPALRHMLEGESGGHPAELYQAMIRLAGALTTFSGDVQVNDLPLYNHLNSSDCFKRLDQIIYHLLGTVIPQRYVSLPLREQEGFVYAVALDEDRLLRPKAAFLAIRSQMDRATLIAKLPQLVKISSGERLGQLIKQALPGLPMSYVAVPPEDLPMKLDYSYFQLDIRAEDWESIMRAGNFGAYVPSDFPVPELELVLLLPSPN